MTDVDPLLTVAQLARSLGKGQSTIYWMVKEKNLPYQKVGNRMMFSRDAVAAYLADKRSK